MCETPLFKIQNPPPLKKEKRWISSFKSNWLEKFLGSYISIVKVSFWGFWRHPPVSHTWKGAKGQTNSSLLRPIRGAGSTVSFPRSTRTMYLGRRWFLYLSNGEDSVITEFGHRGQSFLKIHIHKWFSTLATQWNQEAEGGGWSWGGEWGWG
jgi:hypothetical protein